MRLCHLTKDRRSLPAGADSKSAHSFANKAPRDDIKLAYLSENTALDGSSHIIKTLTPTGLSIFNRLDFRRRFHLPNGNCAPQLAAAPFSKVHPTMKRAKELNNKKQ